MTTFKGAAPGAARRTPARRGEGRQLREEILSAAAGRIAETGDATQLSLRGIAREVGVAATSIYLHFESIEALLADLKRCRFDELCDAVERAAEAAGPNPASRVRARIHAYARYGRQHPGEYVVLFAAGPLTPSAPPTPTRTIAALDALEADVANALTANGLPTADEVHLVTMQLWAAVHGIVILRVAPPPLPGKSLRWPDFEPQLDDLVDRLLVTRRS